MTWQEFATDPRYQGGVLESIEARGVFLACIRSIEYFPHGITLNFDTPSQVVEGGLKERPDLMRELNIASEPFDVPISTWGSRPEYAPPPPELIGLADGRVLIVPPAAVLERTSMLIVYPKGMRKMEMPAAA